MSLSSLIVIMEALFSCKITPVLPSIVTVPTEVLNSDDDAASIVTDPPASMSIGPCLDSISIVPLSDCKRRPVEPDISNAPFIVKLPVPTPSIVITLSALISIAPCLEVMSISPESDAIFKPVDPDTVNAPLEVTLDVPTPSIENVDVPSIVIAPDASISKAAEFISTVCPVPSKVKVPALESIVAVAFAYPIVNVLVPWVPTLMF